MKDTEIQSDKSSYGIAYILHEESEGNVKEIIEASASGEFENGTVKKR
ncbi:hypothetical protein [Maribacter antarcticus]|nr:hypothetical protein [Maribacter antarcticus]